MRTLLYSIFAMLLATGAQAQSAQPQPSLQSLIAKASSKQNQQKLQQGIVTAVLLNCVEKQAGRERTRGFYQAAEASAKQVRALCKAGKPDQAKALALAELRQKHKDPIVATADQCYTAHAQDVAMMAGPELTAQIAHYRPMLHNPALAEREFATQDICALK